MTEIVIQRASGDYAPDDDLLMSWAQCALNQCDQSGEVTLRIVDSEEMQTLNRTYRDKDALTNVLSFPADGDIRTLHGLLGDIVICPTVVEQEAQAQRKTRDAHFAHLVIHGVLHLLGYDHIENSDAEVMEALETRILASLGISDPYQLPAAS